MYQRLQVHIRNGVARIELHIGDIYPTPIQPSVVFFQVSRLCTATCACVKSATLVIDSAAQGRPYLNESISGVIYYSENPTGVRIHQPHTKDGVDFPTLAHSYRRSTRHLHGKPTATTDPFVRTGIGNCPAIDSH
jgi:hypothetical protein